MQTENNTLEPVPVTLPIKIHKKRGPIPFEGKLTAPNKPIDPEYFNKYYQANLSHNVTCDKCNKIVSFAKIKRHQKTKKCLLICADLIKH
jgi:hypothetical protein